MSKLLEILQSGKVLLGDGAMGTQLHQRGLETGSCPELWNVTHPEVVGQIIRGYLDVGSDLVETNSFGGTRFKLRHYDLVDRTSELNEAAGRIARQAAGSSHWVAGSVGPTGEFLQPLGSVSEADIYEAFREQIVALAAGGVDAICIETMTALDEASVALRAAKDHTDLPVIVTFTFDKTAQGAYRNMMGISPAQAAEEMTRAGADIVGSNCGNGPEDLLAITLEIRAHTDRYLMIQPNAGVPELHDGRTVFRATPDEMAACIKPLVEMGVNIIGGCCGTIPDHIAAMRQALDG